MDNRSIQKDKETVNELLGMALEVIDKYDQPMRPPVRPEEIQNRFHCGMVNHPITAIGPQTILWTHVQSDGRI